METLLLHPGGLGDIILSLPAIALFRRRFPSARVTFAGNLDHLAPIVSGYAERVLSLATVPLHRLYAGEALTKEEWNFWQSFDKIVSWTGAGDSQFAKNLKAIHPDTRVAPWRPNPGDDRHVSRLFAESLDLDEKELPPASIQLDANILQEGRRWLVSRGWDSIEPLAALHPGAGSAIKRWPLSRFVELARYLALQKKNKLLIIEGPAEPGFAKQISKELPVSQAIPAESLPLDLLAAVLAQCKVFVGNDSGIAHLAAALNLGCLVLFGPTLPQHWSPLGSKIAVLRNAESCEGCASGGNAHTCMGAISTDDAIRVFTTRFQP